MDSNYFRYKNQECPVCHGHFNGETDDIVVCPLCGTPHHRECYNKNGECANSEKHNENFRWSPAGEQSDAPIPPVSENAGAQYGENTAFPPFSGQFPPVQNSPLNLFPAELDDGVSTEDAAVFVQSGYFRYIERFFHQKSGKNTWNWGAFLFTPYWFFYRKLYKHGAIFMIISLAISGICSFLPPAASFSEKFSVLYYEFLQNPEVMPYDLMQNKMLSLIYANKTGFAILVIGLILMLAVHIIGGMFANKFYYEHTVNTVRNINREIPADEQNNDRRKFQILRRGGLSLAGPILAMFASSTVTLLLNILLL